MRVFRHFFALIVGLLPLVVQAQVLTTQPVFFRESDPVTITYDATQGNGALANFTGDVYIWTGVVTNLSATNTTWRHVKSPSFGQADPLARMNRSASNPNIYTIQFVPRNFYPVPANETILRLAMIFKDAAGNVVGRSSSGGDMFIDVYQGGPAVRLTQPASGGNPLFVAAGAALPVSGSSAQAANLTLTLNGAQVSQATNATSITASVTPSGSGRNVLRLTAGSGATAVSDSVILVVRPQVVTAALPAGAKEGVTYLPGGTSVILALTAPNKQFVYAVGEFNNFQPENSAFMNRTPDGNMWWVQLNGLTAGREYAYQYLVDGTLRVADPYTEKVLDPANDRFIPAVTYPGLRYPAGQTGIMATFQSNQTPYVWQTTNFQRPAKTNLVVYELHLRDFIARHDFQTLRDTLGYLQRLGVNCIELMPVNEFEGNDSWGYNPSFYFAVDKYYGTKDAFKRFIDEAHRRGMAVVIDMVLNHSFGQSPMVQMYFDGNPTANSPWFNRNPTHPFNVGYDFNHESPFTKRFSKNVMDFWLREYRLDGYRFDLSKGFTQRNSGNDVGLWSQYDQSRVDIWLDYNTHMQNNFPGIYPILEHFADNREETLLANAGLMFWGNIHGAATDASIGNFRSANFSSAYHVNRGWMQPNLLAYMESHDEERNMYDALTRGQSSGSYNIRTLSTALERMEMNSAFFFTIPGPKMIWQFGELGYDVSINQGGRTGAKPIRWNYFQDPDRREIYNVYANMTALKKHPAFATGTFASRMSSQGKTVQITHPSLNVTVIGNFGLTPIDVNPMFQRTGRWYNYLSGDSITVTGTTDLITLAPGQYAVYLDRRMQRVALANNKAAQADVFRLMAAPNPAAGTTTLHYQLPSAGNVQILVSNVLGQTVRTISAGRKGLGYNTLELPVSTLSPGVYMVRLQAANQQQTLRLVVE